nr:hypothetical protein [Micromonospora sp. DSM 115978]
ETDAATEDLVVHVARVGQRRVVTSVREYGEFRDGGLTSAELWAWEARAGRAVRTDTEPTDRLHTKLLAAGLNPAVLARGRSTW